MLEIMFVAICIDLALIWRYAYIQAAPSMSDVMVISGVNTVLVIMSLL